MLHHWGYLLAGLFFMLGFAAFSSVSITMAIPLFDFVFKSNPELISIQTFPVFRTQLIKSINSYISAHGGFFNLFENENYKHLLNGLNEVFSKTDPMLLLWMISITVVILIVLKNFFFFMNKVMFANLRGITVKEIRDQMFKKYLYQSLAFFGSNKVGDSLVRMVEDVRIISKFFIHSLFIVIRNAVLIMMYANLALILNTRLFLISLVLLPIFSLAINYVGNKIKKYAKRIQKQSSNLFSNVEESLNSMRIVKAFSREEYEMEKFKSINLKNFKFWRKAMIYKAFNVPLSEFNGTIMGILVLIIGGKAILAHDTTFTLGAFTSFLLALFSMLHPIKKITEAYADIRRALVSLDRIYHILNRKSEIMESESQISKDSFNEKIELGNVCFSYDDNQEVLTDVSFQIEKGQQVALVGNSGSGKTTIVNLLSRMYDATSGVIKMDGTPIENINLRDLRTLFGTVTQESILFHETIANNIRYGSLKECSEEDVKEAAQIAFADEFIETMPGYYEAMVSPKGGNLSGGQKQRLCIARAIVGNPPILIFDEATSALDSESEQKVQQAIEQATRNRTVIVIAHRLSTVLSSDKIIVMDQGKVVGIGTHQELLENCERYQTLYEIQFADNS
ncbi:MAG: ABC transporter ATP-binding protein/permease [Candidatus Cloacimonetes bacterium]|nr:ABC transporter ATP-binding protein/permease [Candidatus Cloacimonadota bacterium]